MWFWCQTGLKVGIEGTDCRLDEACMEHATCDNITSLQCVCDNHYGPRADGTCGMLIFSFLFFFHVQCEVQIFVICANSPRYFHIANKICHSLAKVYDQQSYVQSIVRTVAMEDCHLWDCCHGGLSPVGLSPPGTVLEESFGDLQKWMTVIWGSASGEFPRRALETCFTELSLPGLFFGVDVKMHIHWIFNPRWIINASLSWWHSDDSNSDLSTLCLLFLKEWKSRQHARSSTVWIMQVAVEMGCALVTATQNRHQMTCAVSRSSFVK